MTSEQRTNNVFQTPNPIELRQAAQQDPIPEKYPEMTGDTNLGAEKTTAHPEQQQDNVAAELATGESQAVTVNISGH